MTLSKCILALLMLNHRVKATRLSTEPWGQKTILTRPQKTSLTSPLETSPANSHALGGCPIGATGTFATLDGAGFRQCLEGELIGSFSCPTGDNFDESLQVCGSADSLTTPLKTSLTRPSNTSQTNSHELGVLPAPMSSLSTTSLTCGTGCPIGATGSFTTLDCAGFMHCLEGNLVGTFSCPSDDFNLFDESLLVCNQAGDVTCQCSSSCPGRMLEIEITTDEYPEDTGWTLTNTCGQSQVVGSRLPDYYTSLNTKHIDTICVPDEDAAYEFIITDKFAYGGAAYRILENGVEMISGELVNITQYSETRTFGSCPPCFGRTLEVEITTDAAPMETSWTLTNTCGQGQVVGSRPTFESYTSQDTTYIDSFCVPDQDAAYEFTINDAFGDGLCCELGQGGYRILLDGVEMITGGEFNQTETQSFGSCAPTASPTLSSSPTTSSSPSKVPSQKPSANPSSEPSSQPSLTPSISGMPSSMPSTQPSSQPSDSSAPSAQPSSKPSSHPSFRPSTSSSPSEKPSISQKPSGHPSLKPSVSAAPSVSASPSISQKPSLPCDLGCGCYTQCDPCLAAPEGCDFVNGVCVPKEPSSKPSEAPSTSVSPTLSSAPSISVKPTTSAFPTEMKMMEVPAPSHSPTTSPTPLPTPPPTPLPTPPPTHLEPATIGPGTIFEDTNQNGIQDVGETSLGNIIVALLCAQNGQAFTKIATTTDISGQYIFNEVAPGVCFIQVETGGYVYSPVVQGGNQLGPDGRSPVVDVKSNDVIDYWDGGLYRSFTEMCIEHCPNTIQDCGWGIWNTCTCQCDCHPGFCLSANQKCYDGCLTHEDVNTWAGCRAGVDCPWYPSKLGETHCESSANFAGIHNLHKTAESCCQVHFGGDGGCVQASIADVQAEQNLVQEKLDRDRFYWPDLHGKKNCVFDSGYEDWMVNLSASYLFDNEEGCCGTWFPTKTDCPDTSSAVTPFQVDYQPDPSQQYYYPHLAGSNCRFGRNFPMWMMMSPKHYLYTTAEQCCSEWYANRSDCPSAEDDGVQEGFYWVVDEAFYPNFKGDNCAQGNSYPEWMADPTNRDSHIFATAKACCDFWFPDRTNECQNGVVTVMNGLQIAGPDVTGTWYPTLNGLNQCVDGTPPAWMTQSEGYSTAYVFDSHAECCKAYPCVG